MNILNADLSEIMVTVGGQPCVLNTDLVTATVSAMVTNDVIYLVLPFHQALSCTPPNFMNTTMYATASYNVTVSYDIR